jgi:hypothetical protein
VAQAQRGGAQRQRGIEVNNPALLHHRDVLQRCRLIALLADPFEYFQQGDRRHHQRGGVLDCAREMLRLRAVREVFQPG